jgi:hypothetical protein
MTVEPDRDAIAPADEARRRATRRRRSIMLALVLGVAVILFYVLTIARMGPNIFDRVL